MPEKAREDLPRPWVANAAEWTRAVREGRIESRRVATDEAIVEAVLSRNPRRVADVGCGEGWLVRQLTARGIEAVGVDSSTPLIEEASAAGQGTFLLHSYAEISADPHKLGRNVDVVVCNFALLDKEIDSLLRALIRVLSPAGTLIVQTVHPWVARSGAPYEDGWRVEDFKALGLACAEPMPWYYRTLASWVSLLVESGYRIQDIREPVHPETGEPLSLMLLGSPKI